MKIDFSNLNLAPTPNPKALTVERVSVCIETVDEQGHSKFNDYSTGYIRNASIHPVAHTGRW